MKILNKLILLTIAIVAFSSCNEEEKADAYGNFESTEVTVSAEANGKLISFNLEEGDSKTQNSIVGQVDTVALHLQKNVLLAKIESTEAKKPNVLTQVKVLKSQLNTAQIELNRVKKLFEDAAATQQQLDQANGQVDVLKDQIKNVQTNYLSIDTELYSIQAQIDQVNDQIEKATITNPINGIILTKLAEEGEYTSTGKPLYRISNLSELDLRAFVDETQLHSIKLGQTVKVLIDKSKKETKEYSGTITWVSSEAEFTPKTIQTKKERVNLVYAIKIRVKNDGSLKIGMPAEVWF
ncbi:HlyD family secretion protein [Aureibacter tunicatorum]|uniref:HlyD family secretion protein n=1 Tax=Aureibacter tunicatorum TaxID=866807 RepID=A0AAE3XIU5_9BACT|nr:HlyD family efflux transporter periplasmic adaptor subunit [Aureibacter tunicatorum]MDR6237513.1 HlyD family secretion protein [Aureibacter tunicatorum]BDD02547.1 membrane protein [Aureibacter tunicatorum]